MRDKERDPEWVLLRVRLRDADRLCDRDPLLLDDQLFTLSCLEGLRLYDECEELCDFRDLGDDLL